MRSADGRIAVAGLTLDFGNTLVRVDRTGLRGVVDRTAAALLARGVIEDPAAFLAGWATERDRQFRLQVPRLLEVDLAERVRHVLAGLRGAPIPDRDDVGWDEVSASARVEPAEIEFAVDTYSDGFVAAMAPAADADSTLRVLHTAGHRLGILSNWPLARTIDRYVEVHGWDSLLAAVVVSQRVGVIKPHPGIFAAASAAMGLLPEDLLHVGDDWAADVVGARGAGWRTAYLRGHQGDTPLPTSSRDDPARPFTAGDPVQPTLEIDALAELPPRLAVGTNVVAPAPSS